jgi:ankyrin repeat protein
MFSLFNVCSAMETFWWIVSKASHVSKGALQFKAEQDLFAAITARSLDGVRSAIDRGANPNAIDSLGNTALYMATSQAFASAVSYLIGMGAMVDMRAPFSKTPLQRATELCAQLNATDDETLSKKNRYADIARTLVENGAQVNVPVLDSWTPLIVAARDGQTNLASAIIKAGADVHYVSRAGANPLQLSLHAGKPEIAILLIKAGVNGNGKEEETSALSIAIDKNFKDVIFELLDQKDLMIESTNREGLRPLLNAFATKQPDVALALLQKGAAIESKHDRVHPLFLALYLQYDAVALEIIKRGVDPNMSKSLEEIEEFFAPPSADQAIRRLEGRETAARSPSTYYYPLHLAAEKRASAQVVRALIAKGARINEQRSNGMTPLHIAAAYNFSGIAGALLELPLDYPEGNYAHKHLQDAVGNIPLHYAAEKSPAITALLLQQNGKSLVDTKNMEGKTPLHCAALAGQAATTLLLLDANAQASESDLQQKTALDYAHHNQLILIAALRQALVTQRPRPSRTESSSFRERLAKENKEEAEKAKSKAV